MKKEFDFPKVKVVIDGRIISFITKEDAIATLEDVKPVIDAIIDLLDENQSYGLLTDFIKGVSMSREARDYAAQHQLGKNSFHAVVINHRFKKFLVDSYMLISKPIMETKIFDNRESALEWLNMKLDTVSKR